MINQLFRRTSVIKCFLNLEHFLDQKLKQKHQAGPRVALKILMSDTEILVIVVKDFSVKEGL